MPTWCQRGPRPQGIGWRGEIQRRGDGLAVLEGAGGFDEGDGGGLDFVADRDDEGADIECGVGQRGEDEAEAGGVKRWEIALQVDHDVVGAVGVEFGERGVHAVGAGGQAGSVSTARAAGGADGVGDFGVAAGHGDRADIGFRPRSSMCRIIGLPSMSASGLPGRRVEAMRAGMTTMGFKGVGFLDREPAEAFRMWVEGAIPFPYGGGSLRMRSSARNAGWVGRLMFASSGFFLTGMNLGVETLPVIDLDRYVAAAVGLRMPPGR